MKRVTWFLFAALMVVPAGVRAASTADVGKIVTWVEKTSTHDRRVLQRYDGRIEREHLRVTMVVIPLAGNHYTLTADTSIPFDPERSFLAISFQPSGKRRPATQVLDMGQNGTVEDGGTWNEKDEVEKRLVTERQGLKVRGEEYRPYWQQRYDTEVDRILGFIERRGKKP